MSPHRHIWKGIGWSALITIPGFFVVERLTRRRGGMERPEVVPFALLVLAVFGLAVTPFGNAVSRRYEAEADWTALQTTRDPDPAESMFKKFTVYDLVQPNPPGWSYRLDRQPPDGGAANRDGASLESAAALGRAASSSSFSGVSGRLRMPSRDDHFDHESCIASSSSLHEPRRHVHPRDDDAGHVAFLDLVVDSGEGERELVVGEADVGEVRVDTGQVLRVEMDVELALLGVVFHPSRILRG